MRDDTNTLVERLAPGARIDRSWPLTGGVSAETVAVAFTRPGGVQQRVVIRRHQAHDWKPQQASVTATEHAVLEALHARGLPVPRPLLLDPPVLVLEYVDGTCDLPPDGAQQMADALAAIHAVPPDAVAAALPRLEEGPEPREETLLHGDFWPGNLLWRDGRLAAVLDWEDASVGDPLSDLACARVELVCAAGPEILQAFTERYLEQTGRDAAHLPAWDLYVSTAALDSMDQWGLPADVLEARRKATQAFRDHVTLG